MPLFCFILYMKEGVSRDRSFWDLSLLFCIKGHVRREKVSREEDILHMSLLFRGKTIRISPKWVKR